MSSARRDQGIRGPGRFFFWWARLVWPLQALFAGVRIPPPPAGLHDGPSILIANHRSMFDVMVGVTLCRRWRRPAAFLVNARYFDDPRMKLQLRLFGAVPIDPSAPMEALRTTRALLEAGTSVLIMPEGRLADPGTPIDQLLDIGPGAAMLASRTGVPIFVGGIHGADHVWPADAEAPVTRPWRRGHVTVCASRLDVVEGTSRRVLNGQIAAEMQHQLDLAVAIGTGRSVSDAASDAGAGAHGAADTPASTHPAEVG